MEQTKVQFTFGNAKLNQTTAILSILAGTSCPGAMDCKSHVQETENGKRIVDGEHTQFRCYAASMELRSPNAYQLHKRNFETLRNARSVQDKVNILVASIKEQQIDIDCRRVRIHSSGDFFVQSYFDAWLEVAKMYPEIVFYAYTKSIKFWVRRLDEIPNNFKLTASYGGQMDSLIDEYGLKNVRVVFSPEEAKELGLPIDKDDSHAWNYDGNFAQLIHGTQPAGSLASRALQALRKRNIFGYSRDKKKSA
jgi:hypothetical protein